MIVMNAIFNSEMILSAVGVGYPKNSLLVFLQPATIEELGKSTFDKLKASMMPAKPLAIEMLIFSNYKEQRQVALKELSELLKAFDIHLPKAIQWQPQQVAAATYARAIAKYTAQGSIFTNPCENLPIIKVSEEKGVSKHHHKEYVNYHFKLTDKTIDREKVMKRKAYIDDDYSSWYQLSKVRERARPVDVKSDSFFWFDEEGNDRGDDEDLKLFLQSFGLSFTSDTPESEKKKILKLFYRIKFEVSDQEYYKSYYGYNTTNIPVDLFEHQNTLKSLPAQMLRFYQQYGHRPDARKINEACKTGRLTNHAWNGQWISDKKRASRNRHFN